MRPVYLLIAVVLLAGACSVDDRNLVTRPDPILIDDFEDMDGQPTDPRLGVWEFTTFNADPESSDASLFQPGFDSNVCMRVDWNVTDMPDGILNYPGFLAVTRALGAIDLTAYTHINFMHRYQHVGSCVALQFVNVSIGCSELDSSVFGRVPVSSSWTAASVALADLAEGFYPPPRGVDRNDCLRVADSFTLVTDSDVADGQCQAGTLFFDNLTLTAD